MTKWRPGFNSRCQIGIDTLSMNELIIVGEVKDEAVKNNEKWRQWGSLLVVVQKLEVVPLK